MPRPRGRPTLKDPKKLEKIYELARQGKTDAQISKIVGITHRTLCNWKVSDWEFVSNLKENKMLADEMVEASLFKRATGYNYTEEASTREGIVALKKHAPPDATSMIFWLKNRKPKVWRDKVEHEHSLSERETLKLPDGRALEIEG